ncbi:LOW QUALITY PROTEIN: uncharacterized protein LOC135195701 [Macrobrachium nipponense]|uniref:LOW QUALITY PROTEIN: uncharacterized protein LOC135195701 n=1 Tax=Macrobrachium nipponense TaxID=159736 RepID=UPI0030C81AED
MTNQRTNSLMWGLLPSPLSPHMTCILTNISLSPALEAFVATPLTWNHHKKVELWSPPYFRSVVIIILICFISAEARGHVVRCANASASARARGRLFATTEKAVSTMESGIRGNLDSALQKVTLTRLPMTGTLQLDRISADRSFACNRKCRKLKRGTSHSTSCCKKESVMKPLHCSISRRALLFLHRIINAEYFMGSSRKRMKLRDLEFQIYLAFSYSSSDMAKRNASSNRMQLQTVESNASITKRLGTLYHDKFASDVNTREIFGRSRRRKDKDKGFRNDETKGELSLSTLELTRDRKKYEVVVIKILQKLNNMCRLIFCSLLTENPSLKRARKGRERNKNSGEEKKEKFSRGFHNLGKMSVGDFSTHCAQTLLSINTSNTASNKQHLFEEESSANIPSQLTRRQKRRAGGMMEVTVMEGGLAELPCDLQVSHPNDSVQLILWIKEGIHTPLYSYDYRELQGGRPKEMKPDANSTMARRTFFRSDKSTAALLVEKVEADDAGIYRCRADFSLSPTINTRINLTIIVPPRRVRVSWRLEGSDKTRAKDRKAGPFLEKSRPTLICSNDDGWPPSSVVWYEDDTLLDDSYRISDARGLVENEMTLRPLTRSDLGRQLTCLASNNNNTQPANITVLVEMTLSILGVRVGEMEQMWANEETKVECTVWGSRPPPTIVWWLGSHVKGPAVETMVDEGNWTISLLSFTPTPNDDGVMLICQATNDNLPDMAIQDSTLLSVHYAPIVRIRLGPSLHPEFIKEGDDVYFECAVKAKPQVFKTVWRQNGQVMTDGDGVFISNMSLVIQRVTRAHAGEYSCEATNIKSTTTSPPINLDVKYTPLCIQEGKNYFAVARRANVIVPCKVTANPSDVTFNWVFNNSAGANRIPDDQFIVVEMESRISYTPRDEMDYGTLQCWANNTIGMQSEPCMYKIIPAGKPDPPHNCGVSAVTISSLQVVCLPGDDGGLNQTFLLQVFQIGSEQIPVGEVKSETPNFNLANLRPATPYKIVVVATNTMGTSRVIELKTFTSRVLENQQETNAEAARDREKEMGIPAFVLVGGGVMLVPLIVVIIVVVRLEVRRHSHMRGRNDQGGRPSSAHPMDTPYTEFAYEISADIDECDPDILSHTQGVTRPLHWSNVGADIAGLSTSASNHLRGGSLYATALAPPVSLPIMGLSRGRTPGLPVLHSKVISEPDVHYCMETHQTQDVAKVAVLSTSFYINGKGNLGKSVSVQSLHHPKCEGSQQLCRLFSHKANSTSRHLNESPMRGLPYNLEDRMGPKLSDNCQTFLHPQRIIQKSISKIKNDNRPLSSCRVGRSSTKKLYPATHTDIGTGLNADGIPRIGTALLADLPKVESCV